MSKPTKQTLDIVWERDQDRCFNCWKILHRSQGGYSVHHRIPRGMGGSRDPVLDSPANLVLLCGTGTTGCHGLIEQNREMYTAYGFLISHLSLVDPTRVPIRRWGTEEVKLGRTGEVMVL